MFVLTDKKSGGIYSVLNKENQKTVQCFEEEDDCIRYHDMLLANGTEHELNVMEVDDELISINCGSHFFLLAINGLTSNLMMQVRHLLSDLMVQVNLQC